MFIQSLVSCAIMHLQFCFWCLRYLPRGIGRNGGSQIPAMPSQTYRRVSCAFKNQRWGRACPALALPPGPPWFDRALLASLNHAWASFWDSTWLSLGRTGRQSSDYSDSSWPNKDLFEVRKVEKSLLYVFLGKIFICMRLFRCGPALR